VTETSSSEPAEDKTAQNAAAYSDRMLPGWAGPISWVFVTLASVGWLSVTVLALFFHELVITGGDAFMAPFLLVLGLVPVAAALVLEWGYARALAGYRVLRKPVEAQVRAGVAALVFVVLTLVHPLLAAGLALGVGANLGLARVYGHILKRDPLWDFNKDEAASFLAGRDDTGFRLATMRPPGGPSVVRAYRNAATAVAALVVLAGGSWLVSEQVIQGSAVLAALLMTLWSVEAVGSWLVLRETENPLTDHLALAVEAVAEDDDTMPAAHNGLIATGLTVTHPDGHTILHDVSLDIQPGVMVGLLGETAAGKSLLLKTLVDPHDLSGLNVRGRAHFAQSDLWARNADQRALPAAHLPRSTLLMPASGLDNLSCYGDQVMRERARRILEQLLFSQELADEVLSAPDARRLSSGQRKALGLARMFLLNPGLYLFDRPEDAASEALIAALCQRIQMERRAGRSFVVVTDNRALLEMCDELVVMDSGRIIDKGPANDVRERMTAGWSRLVVERALDSEDAVQSWIRSHFRRDGDEKNRRDVSIVASELLALSVQEQSGTRLDKLSFDFKHQQGHCILRLRDSAELISAPQIMKAEREKVTDAGRTPPTALARIFRATTFFEQEQQESDRVITVKIKTYDPRLKRRDGAEFTKDAS